VQGATLNERTSYTSAAIDNNRLAYAIRSYDRVSSSARGTGSSSPGLSGGISTSTGTGASKSPNDNTSPSTKSNLATHEKLPDLPRLPEKTTDQTDALVPNPDHVPLTQSEFDVIRYTNTLRQQADKPLLIVKQNLMDTARLSSDRMNNQNRMVHGLTSGWQGENIATRQNSAHEVTNCWKNSPKHYSNIMGDFEYIGVGDTTEKKGNNYWTQQFG
jgi:uncharacterized protein YkwD